MSKILALAALVCVPIAAAAGYVAHTYSPPPLGEYLASTQNVQHVPGQDSDDWIAVVTSGPNKGGAADVFQAMFMAPTHKLLEAAAGGHVVYVEMKCQNYSTDGMKAVYTAPLVVRKCTSTPKTRKQVEKYVLEQMQPEPKS